jgi:hypothetical protein
MHYLYAYKREQPRKLVATFSSDQQLRSYVRWATLHELGPQRGKFEQGSILAGFDRWESSAEPLSEEDATLVEHNPTPSML